MICQLMRIVIVLIPVIIFGILIRKIDLKMNEFLSYIFFLFIVFIMFILSQVPFEYLFMRFNTIEGAFHYSYKNGEILETFERSEYGVVRYVGGSGYNKLKGIAIFVKKGEKWSGKNNTLVSHKFRIYDDNYINIYKIDKYNVVYLEIKKIEKNNIFDSKGTVYNCDMVSENSKYYTGLKNTCSSLVENIDDNFNVTIGEKTFYLKDF